MKRHKVPPTDSKWSADLPFKQTKAFLTTCKDTPTFEIQVNHGEGIQFQSKNDEETLTMELAHDEVNLHAEESQNLDYQFDPRQFTLPLIRCISQDRYYLER